MERIFDTEQETINKYCDIKKCNKISKFEVGKHTLINTLNLCKRHLKIMRLELE